jgi:predicted transposase YbfD/YdcC
MGKINITEYFADVETSEEHNGYFCSVEEALTIVILGSLCGLRNVSQIHQWAAHAKMGAFWRKHFGIERIPCYYWLLCLLKIIKPASLNRCFLNWVQSFLPDGVKEMTLSFDGKTIRSTGKKQGHKAPLHIVSAHIGELGLTLAQQTVQDKSNEIPAMRELIALLDMEGCIVVADALHCQKETARAIVSKKADYLLNAKGNQTALEKDIADYVQDSSLRKGMDTAVTREKNRGRIEERRAYVTHDIGWLEDKGKWASLACIGAINRQITTKTGKSNEWHYYISSRKLTAAELLKHARLEWSVESMHWLLDVHFGEDFCRVEDEAVQQTLNIVRKIALNCVKNHKQKRGLKSPLAKIMLYCLIDPDDLLSVLASSEN